MDCKGRSRETSYEALAVIWVREDGCSGKGGKLEVSKVEATGFANGFQVKCERQERRATVWGFSHLSR